MECIGITDSAALPDGRDVSGLKGSQEPKIEPTGSLTENVFGQSAVSSSLSESSVDIIAVLGPIGLGKSTLSQFIQNHLKSQGLATCIIDGDDLPGLGKDITRNLSSERAPLTLWRVLQSIARGEIPILSIGGGVAAKSFRDPSCVLPKLIAKAFGLQQSDMKLTLVVPDDLDVYSNTDRVVASTEWRVAQGLWKLPKGQTLSIFGKSIAKLSKENRKFAEAFQADATTVVQQPVVDHGSYQSYSMECRGVFDHVTANHPRSPPMCNQVRLLVTIPNSKAGHITLSYCKEGGLIVPEMSEEPVSMEVVKVSCTKDGCRSTPSAFVPSGAFVGELPLPDNAHVTLTTGPHQPFCLGHVVKAFNDGDTEVSLHSKSGPVTYGIKVETVPTTVNVVTSFGVVNVM
jgi:hypothetical protein